MRGIRVGNIPKHVVEKHLRIYFSKPENNGGKIAGIYYPLINNDAVIIFQNSKVVDHVLKTDHKLLKAELELQQLPEKMIFSSLEAKLENDVSMLILSDPNLKDQIRYADNIEVIEGDNQTLTLRGNWYQLEWAWHMLDCIIQQQTLEGEAREQRDGDLTEMAAEAASLQPKSNTPESEEPLDAVHGSMLRNTARESHQRQKSPALSDLSSSYPTRQNTLSGDYGRHRQSDENATFEKFSTPVSQSVSTDSTRQSPTSYKPHSDRHSYTRHETSYDDDANRFTSLPLNLNDRHTDLRRAESPDISRYLTASKYAGKTDFSKSLKHSRPTDDVSDKIDAAFGHSHRDSTKESNQRLKSTALNDLQSSYSSQELCFTTNIKGIKVSIHHGSIIEETTEAIVNAATKGLEHRCGIPRAIADARGPEINDECREYIKKHGKLKTTKAMRTSGGGRIKSANIIHAAGPVWSEQLKDTFTKRLTETFLNCFQLAEKMRLKSLAVPAISTGANGAPLDECVKAYLFAVLLFSQDGRHLVEIRMLNNYAENSVMSIVLMKTLLETGLEELKSQAAALFSTSPSGTRPSRGFSRDLTSPSSGLRRDLTSPSSTPSRDLTSPSRGLSRALTSPSSTPSRDLTSPSSTPSRALTSPSSTPSRALTSSSSTPSRDLNIPRGRQERSGSLSRTYTRSGQSEATKSAPRRSSSQTRISDRSTSESRDKLLTHTHSGYF